jgi:hypothetical protein
MYDQIDGVRFTSFFLVLSFGLSFSQCEKKKKGDIGNCLRKEDQYTAKNVPKRAA